MIADAGRFMTKWEKAGGTTTGGGWILGVRREGEVAFFSVDGARGACFFGK